MTVDIYIILILEMNIFQILSTNNEHVETENLTESDSIEYRIKNPVLNYQSTP